MKVFASSRSTGLALSVFAFSALGSALPPLFTQAHAAEIRVASAFDYEVRKLDLDNGERGDILVTINAGGQSPENFIVNLERVGDTVQIVERRRTGRAGTVRFRNVEPGDSRLSVEQNPPDPDSYQVRIGDLSLSKSKKSLADEQGAARVVEHPKLIQPKPPSDVPPGEEIETKHR